MSKYTLLKTGAVLFSTLIFSIAWATTTQTTSTNTQPSMQTTSNSEYKQKQNDSVITQKVQAKLNSNGNKSITVSTENGQVTLTGNVKDNAQKQKVIKIAKNVKGVKQVKDNLTIKQ